MMSSKGRLLHITWVHTDLMVTRTEIKLCEKLSTVEFIK
jgi:hypothetical protein